MPERLKIALHRGDVPPPAGYPARTVPGDGADNVRLRQVLHVLHCAEGAARAEPPGRRNPGEVHRLADDSCLEFTLLSQTVSSYQDATGPRTVHLADLLYMLHDIEGMRRLKFVTNHPRHMTDDLLHAMCDLPKVSPYLHIPAQSGSNAVLRRMKRGYTAESYREMLGRIRQAFPRAAVTSDFIVGFCGESEEEFQQTVDLVRNARFKNSFIFKYSARPGTKAAELYKDDVPESVKRQRNNELLAVQNAISLEDSQPGPDGGDFGGRAEQSGEEAGAPSPRPSPGGRGRLGAACGAHCLRPDCRVRRSARVDRPHFTGGD